MSNLSEQERDQVKILGVSAGAAFVGAIFGCLVERGRNKQKHAEAVKKANEAYIMGTKDGAVMALEEILSGRLFSKLEKTDPKMFGRF